MNFEYDRLSQRIGEFVISFQWMENLFREIGWLIDDPQRKNWPPLTLRDLNNYELLEEVKRKFCDLMDTLNIPDSEDRKLSFEKLINESHEMRKFRNNLLHSAYIEMKSGDEVVALLRSNPKLESDPETGGLIFDQELLLEESILTQMKSLAELAIKSNMTYMQLIHWAPFSHLQNN